MPPVHYTVICALQNEAASAQSMFLDFIQYTQHKSTTVTHSKQSKSTSQRSHRQMNVYPPSHTNNSIQNTILTLSKQYNSREITKTFTSHQCIFFSCKHHSTRHHQIIFVIK